MKYRKLEKWDYPEESINLIFFAQLLDELFFDFSLDTYKPSAMNSSLLCEEALGIIKEIGNGNIKKPNLQHILDELCENLSKDPVVSELLSIDLKQINSVLLNPKEPEAEKKIIVELVLRQIYLKKYKNKNEDLLKNAIYGDKNFRLIRGLTRSYATTLINLGYSSEYISEVVKKFFHYDKNRISGKEAIDDFLKIFSEKPELFTLVFKIPKSIKNYKTSYETFNIKFLDELSDLTYDLSNHKFKKNADQLYICLSEIKARDIFSAKSEAERILDILSTVFGLYHHKEQINWQPDCLIINERTKVVERSKTKINVMHKCADQKQSQAAKNANSFLSEFGLEENSFRKFTRSAELHSLALSSDSSENQILNLWIALESIIPINNNDKIANIEHIINSTIPFLNLIYYQRLVARFTSDLFNWDKRQTRKVLKNIDGDTSIIKVAKLVSLKEYELNRLELNSYFKDFHLMSDRFNYLCYIYSSPKNMLEGLDSHSKRIGWQIRRVYRARNLIVHCGITPSYIEVLIENIHDYLDTVMNRIIQLAAESKKITSIEQSFKYVFLVNAQNN